MRSSITRADESVDLARIIYMQQVCSLMVYESKPGQVLHLIVNYAARELREDGATPHLNFSVSTVDMFFLDLQS